MFLISPDYDADASSVPSMTTTIRSSVYIDPTLNLSSLQCWISVIYISMLYTDCRLNFAYYCFTLAQRGFMVDNATKYTWLAEGLKM